MKGGREGRTDLKRGLGRGNGIGKAILSQIGLDQRRTSRDRPWGTVTGVRFLVRQHTLRGAESRVAVSVSTPPGIHARLVPPRGPRGRRPGASMRAIASHAPAT